jgi:hypothetical protein
MTTSTSRSDVLDLGRFAAAAEAEREAFGRAEPFPHVVVDGLLDPAATRAVAAEFGGDTTGWTFWHHVNERKRGLSDMNRMGPASRRVIAALHAPEFLRLVERLTGVEGLLADPYLDGGGLHESLPGGYLNVHTDFLAHPVEHAWAREINLLVFLNEGWEPAHRGWLELWDARVTRCVRRIEPCFNRTVIFRTTATSFHGVPAGVGGPVGSSRKSIALYYFRDAGVPQRLRPTRYVPMPDDGVVRSALIRLDRAALWVYSALKRHTPLGDALVSRLLRRL